ncbi:MAG TPA: hypothetical protein VGE12_10030 [Noviherbaspirillum sp.]
MKTWRDAVRNGAVSGSVASLLSTAILAARGRTEAGTSFGPTNAVSHWLWGERAAHHDGPSLRYTAVGYTIHHASATLWAVLYEKWFGERAERGEIVPALTGAAAVSALSCFVDYKMTPERLKPGFEKRLSTPSLFLVYAGFGVALAVRGLAASRAVQTHNIPALH